jgi:sugar phosphate isomerase/epimerase
MKRNFLSLILMMFSLALSAQPKISLFCDHVESIAQQEGISFREAAQKIRSLGYQGLDVSISLSEDKLKILDELGFQHACAISWMDYYKGEQKELEDQTLAFMQKHGYDRVLVVPGFRPGNAPKNADQKVYARLKKFTERANALGLKVMVEDFDNPSSPCYGQQNLDKLFQACPTTEHTFDTGNYLFAGDEVMPALTHFQKRISHVHLKDRLAPGHPSSPAVGTGVIPMTAVIQSLQSAGYSGWYTVEHYGSQQMLTDATLSIRFVQTALKAKDFPQTEAMRPGMSEYWNPQPKLVIPGADASAPSDAIVLFSGKDLKEWENDKGEAAGWKIENGILTVDKSKGDILTRRKFGSFQLHLEWRIPEDITGESQARGNSGVYLQDKYEVQILDSYDNPTYVNGQAGSIYKQTPPLVNAMRAPGEWNTYDIIFTAPLFREDGTYLYPPYVTVIHNGVVVQNHTAIQGTTEYIGFPRIVKHQEGPIRLQSHGDPSAPISFRNIWIRNM